MSTRSKSDDRSRSRSRVQKKQKLAQHRRKVLDLGYFAGFALLLLFLNGFELDLAQQFFVKFWKWEYILANSLVILILLIFLTVYLWLRSPALMSGRLKIFIGSLILIIVLMEKGAGLLSPYLVPVATATGLATIFVGVEVGFVLNVFLAILVGLGGEIAPIESFVALGGGMMALLAMWKLRANRDLAIAGIEIGIVNMLMYLGTSLFSGNPTVSWDVVWAGINGPISSLLILGGIPLAEYITQKTSPVGLMELLNPQHPLLAMLREQAPGTYHHSLTVADLGESAALAIGADPLLTKVGGYYHDIGKIKRPLFFVENQEDGVNPHDEITPNMSKLIITSHVKEGIELGEKFGLKEDILRFIPEHHGTSVIRYFYLKALREQGKELQIQINIGDYRYDAVRPKTKETAILMLADSVEAASRTLADSSHIEDMVEEQISDKLADGQLKESPLTLADLDKIKKAFGETLRAMLHFRPQVPKLPKPAASQKSKS